MNSDTVVIRENITLVRVLSNEIAAFLHGLPGDVWRDADRFASGCENWNAGDVVAHLIDQANQTTLSIERALSGNTAPPLGYGRLAPEAADQRVVELRTAFDEDLFPEFNASCLRLNRLLAGLEPDRHDLEVWHSSGVKPLARLVQYRGLELAVHGWDLRYAFQRDAVLSPPALPLLFGGLEGWLTAAFRGAHDLESTVRLRFDLDDSRSFDLCVTKGGFTLNSATDDAPDVNLKVGVSDYLLLLMGRLPIRRAARRGRIRIEGHEDTAHRLPEWFGPVYDTTIG